jgi:hypothetical protein
MSGAELAQAEAELSAELYVLFALSGVRLDDPRLGILMNGMSDVES